MKGGHSAAVFSRTAAKCADLVANGAVLAPSPKAAAKDADVVFTMVGTPDDVESVTLGPEGVLASLKPGGLIDHLINVFEAVVFAFVGIAVQQSQPQKNPFGVF